MRFRGRTDFFFLSVSCLSLCLSRAIIVRSSSLPGTPHPALLPLLSSLRRGTHPATNTRTLKQSSGRVKICPLRVVVVRVVVCVCIAVAGGGDAVCLSSSVRDCSVWPGCPRVEQIMRGNNQLMRGIHLVISAAMMQRREKRLFGTCGMAPVCICRCACPCVCVRPCVPLLLRQKWWGW